MTGARFSIGQALTAGLRLPVRRPLAVLVWGVSMMLFSGLSAAIILPMLAGLTLPTAENQAEVEAFVASASSAQAVGNLLNLVQIGFGLVVWTAAMRATLKIGRPDKWFFIRVGMDELRVAVVMLAILIGLYFVLIVVTLICVAFGFAFYAMGKAALVAGVFVMTLVVLVAFLAAWSRLSLMPSASVVLGEFAFVEGWRMGRGQTLKLMALNLAIWVIYMLVYAVIGAIVAAVLIGGFFASGCVWPEDPQTVGELAAAVWPMTGWIVLAFLPLTLFAGWAVAFSAGSLTSAARQLADGAPIAAAAADVGDQEASR